MLPGIFFIIYYYLKAVDDLPSFQWRSSYSSTLSDCFAAFQLKFLDGNDYSLFQWIHFRWLNNYFHWESRLIYLQTIVKGLGFYSIKYLLSN